MGGGGGGLGGCTPTPAVIDAPRAVADCICKHIQPTDSAFANEALRPAVCKLVLFTDAFANKTISFANAYILRLVCKRRLSFANAAILQTQTNIYII